MKLDAYRKAFESLPNGISRAEMNAERICRNDLVIADGKAVSSEMFDQTKFYLRAGNEALGAVYTERPDDDVMALLRRAGEQATYMTATQASPMHGADASVHLEGNETPEELSALVDFGAEVEKKLSETQILKLMVSTTDREVQILNHLGLDSSSTTHWTEVSAMLMRKGEPQTTVEVNMSARSLSALSADAFAQKALSKVTEIDGGGLPAIQIPSGAYDCVMTGQVMRNILMTAWRAFSAEAMQAGSSCFHGKEDAVGSACVRFWSAPEHPLSGKQWLLDSEGTRIQKSLLVDWGKLCEPLYTLQSAAQRNATTNGCAGRIPCMTGTIPITLTTVPPFFYLEPHKEKSQEQLIQEMGTGIVLTYSLDLFHSVNIASGLFSVPCGGYYVEHGQKKGSLSQMTVAGNLRDWLQAMDDVANDLDFDDFYFRNYCIGSPSARFQKLSFAS